MNPKCPHCKSTEGYENTMLEVDSVLGLLPNYEAIVCKTCDCLITVMYSPPKPPNVN